MRQFRLLLVLPLILASACGGVPTYQDVDERSGFSPLVPRDGIEEYQIIWVRSWKPTIYIQATVRKDRADGYESGSVQIGRAERTPPKFRRYRLSAEKWRDIEASIEASGFWTRNFPCQEASYREQTLHVDTESGCTEILMMDGARLTMAASKAPRARGLTVVCPDLEVCPPFDAVVRAFLQAVGESSEAL